MRTIRTDRYRMSRKALAAAVAVLESGGVVAFPTETSYGLAADPTDPAAVRKVFRIKGRMTEKSLPLIAGGADTAARAVRLSPRLRRLARRHWPGPLTLVAPARTRALGVRANDGTVAVRVPGSSAARALASAFGRPITATSANLSGAAPCFSGAAVRKAFRGRSAAPDLLLDVGALPRRRPSTIVRERHGKLEVLRKGSVKV